MAKINMYSCDQCGRKMAPRYRTEARIRFKGPVVEGYYTIDLCPDCVDVPEGITLKPLPRRKKKSKAETTSSEDA